MTTVSLPAPATFLQARWLRAVVLLAIVAVLPLRIVDRQIVERDPWHQHVVLSANANWVDHLHAHQRGGEAEADHRYGQVDSGDAATGQRAGTGVVLSQAGGSALSALAAADSSSLTTLWLGPVAAPHATRLSLDHEQRLESVLLPATTPPPRPPERANSSHLVSH